ncbi:MAG: hypothetical protein U0R70_02090 [Solirubrobacteraceae bacterium]
MTAYDTAAWSDLFVATAGASAALAGLVFVSVSINLERILEFPGLPERAAQTLLLLLSVLVVSIMGLVPGQSATALGVELLAWGLILLAATAALGSKVQAPEGAPRGWSVSRNAIVALGTIPTVVGGISLIATSGGGLYWIVAGIVGALAGGLANAWVLLVEILR